LEIKGKDSREQSVIFPKIIQFLVRKRLLTKASDILSRLGKIANDEEGRMVARVSSEKILDEKTMHELKQSLAKRYGAKEVDLILKTDEKLIGGFKIETKDEVIDLTTKNKIKKLQEYLIKSV
jgi:ATP synthase F1 delta subunit